MKVYYQTYYHPDDFNDSRYDPSFSPVAYPGQTFTAVLRANKAVQARLYWKDDRTEAYHYGESVMLSSGAWMDSGGRSTRARGWSGAFDERLCADGVS